MHSTWTVEINKLFLIYLGPTFFTHLPMYMEIRVSDFSSLLKIRFKKGTFPPPLLICTGWLRLLIICTVLQVMTGLLFGTLKWKQIVILRQRLKSTI